MDVEKKVSRIRKCSQFRIGRQMGTSDLTIPTKKRMKRLTYRVKTKMRIWREELDKRDLNILRS